MSEWEFNCPQFVDFSAPLENDHPTDDVFYSARNDEQAISNKSFPVTDPKMVTTKFKPVRTLRSSPFVNISRPVATDDEKCANLGTFRLSNSDGCLNKALKSWRITEKENLILKGHQKKSLSDSCIKKKRICPTTPECLKRTLISKLKKAKTTEELELEKIAEMQNKLQQHLRLNRMNLKRLKMNKAPFTFSCLSRKTNYKTVPSKDKSFEDLEIPSRLLTDSDGRKLRYQSEKNCDNNPTVHAERVDSFARVYTSDGKRNDTKMASANALQNLNGLEQVCKKALKEPVSFKTYESHSGLRFIPKQKTSASSSSLNSRLCTINARTSKKTLICLDNKENLVNTREHHC